MKNIFLLSIMSSVMYFCNAADNCNNRSYIMRVRTNNGAVEYVVPQNRIENIRGQLTEFDNQVQGNAFAVVEIWDMENRNMLSSNRIASSHFLSLTKHLYPYNPNTGRTKSSAPRKINYN